MTRLPRALVVLRAFRGPVLVTGIRAPLSIEVPGAPPWQWGSGCRAVRSAWAGTAQRVGQCSRRLSVLSLGSRGCLELWATLNAPAGAMAGERRGERIRARRPYFRPS